MTPSVKYNTKSICIKLMTRVGLLKIRYNGWFKSTLGLTQLSI
jgi:hypothetical protein